MKARNNTPKTYQMPSAKGNAVDDITRQLLEEAKVVKETDPIAKPATPPRNNTGRRAMGKAAPVPVWQQGPAGERGKRGRSQLKSRPNSVGKRYWRQ